MKANIPLADADRWDWLVQLRKESEAALSSPYNNNERPNGVVLTCSALKRKYRDVIRVASFNHPDILTHFVYLKADEATLLQRVRERKGHFMKEDMVHSQITDLEEPEASERDVITVDCSGTPTEVNALALRKVEEIRDRAR
jgi:gluconokinase